MGKKIKIAGIATKAQGIKWFMLDNLRYAANNGFDVHVLCEQTDIFTYENMVGISFLPQKMSRGMCRLLKLLGVCGCYIKFSEKNVMILCNTLLRMRLSMDLLQVGLHVYLLESIVSGEFPIQTIRV